MEDVGTDYRGRLDVEEIRIYKICENLRIVACHCNIENVDKSSRYTEFVFFRLKVESFALTSFFSLSTTKISHRSSPSVILTWTTII